MQRLPFPGAVGRLVAMVRQCESFQKLIRDLTVIDPTHANSGCGLLKDEAMAEQVHDYLFASIW